jgi:hypothetical protein
MIERRIIEALHSAKPGSRQQKIQEFYGQGLLAMLNTANAAGFKDPAIPSGLETFSATPVLPEGAIRLPDLAIGGRTAKQLESSLASEGFRIGDWARSMLRSRDFTTLPEEQTLNLVRVKVADLGLAGNPTTDQIYAKANDLGLDLCPAEVGPQLRLAYKDQPMDEWLYVGMKQITDSDGNPDVFGLGRDDDGLWLHDDWASPDGTWGPRSEFVFSLRK